MSNKSSKNHIDQATQFNFAASKLQNYYDQWAVDYNRDVDQEAYVAPQIITELVSSLKLPFDCSILDAGCGTGILGTTLKSAGYNAIDGFDLSPGMVSVASQTTAYNKVKGGVDINLVAEHFPANNYDCIVSSGVFTLGHISPQALLKLLEVVAAKGYIVVSTRTQYNAATDYINLSNQWVEQGLIKVIQVEHEKAYTSMDTSSYWIYQKP